jgi:hypothetical protein
MERLEDIIDKDRNAIFEEFRDYTKQHEVQAGAEKLAVWGSLQIGVMTMNAEAAPINAFNFTFYVRDSDLTESFKDKLSQNSIIYVDHKSYSVLDTSSSGGIFAIALKRGVKRGAGLSSGREI